MTSLNKTSNPVSSFSNQLADAVEKIGPSLVLVNGRRRQPASGVVFKENYILTADHVLEREEDITVITHDKRTLPAQFIGRDPASDLAVLKVDGLNLPVAQTDATPRVGQFILAVGRPSEEGVMASAGIVSSIGGPLRSRRGGTLEKFLQTDAIPYPGFSGGPLIDTEGTLLAVLTTRLINGVALGVPASIAWPIAEAISQNGSVKRGYMGISSQPVELPEGQRAGRPQNYGLLVVKVEEDSPARTAGILLGDIMVGLDGQALNDTDDLQALLTGSRVGKAVAVEVIRGGALQTLTVTIGQRA